MERTYSPQPTDTLVQTGRKDAVDVTEDRVCIFAVQLLAKELDHSFELLRCADLEHSILENRG